MRSTFPNTPRSLPDTSHWWSRGGLLLAVVAVPLAMHACAAPGAEGSAESDVAAGLTALETIRTVLQHPRCVNCHPAGDQPLQFDDGRPHGQMVSRGKDGKGTPGLRCASCHGTSNLPESYGPNQPPGAPNWHLPHPSTPMVFAGKSAAELGRALADPKQNGNHTLAEMLEHVRSDPLVLWGWNPGVGRNPVSVPHAEFVAAFTTWIEAGAPTGQ